MSLLLLQIIFISGQIAYVDLFKVIGKVTIFFMIVGPKLKYIVLAQLYLDLCFTTKSSLQ